MCVHGMQHMVTAVFYMLFYIVQNITSLCVLTLRVVQTEIVVYSVEYKKLPAHELKLPPLLLTVSLLLPLLHSGGHFTSGQLKGQQLTKSLMSLGGWQRYSLPFYVLKYFPLSSIMIFKVCYSLVSTFLILKISHLKMDKTISRKQINAKMQIKCILPRSLLFSCIAGLELQPTAC